MAEDQVGGRILVGGATECRCMQLGLTGHGHIADGESARSSVRVCLQRSEECSIVSPPPPSPRSQVKPARTAVAVWRLLLARLTQRAIAVPQPHPWRPAKTLSLHEPPVRRHGCGGIAATPVSGVTSRSTLHAKRDSVDECSRRKPNVTKLPSSVSASPPSPRHTVLGCGAGQSLFGRVHGSLSKNICASLVSVQDEPQAVS